HVVAPDEKLPHHRLSRTRSLTQGRNVSRHVAPSEDSLSFFNDNLLQTHLDVGALIGLLRQVDDTGTVVPESGQLDTGSCCDFAKKFIRHLNQDACPVPCVRFATASAAMIKV